MTEKVLWSQASDPTNFNPSADIREMNRYPFTEMGLCWQCGRFYSLTQLRLPDSKLNERPNDSASPRAP